MAAYLGLIILLIIQGHLLSVKGRRLDKLFVILSFLEILFIAGLRVPVGGDSEEYIDMYLVKSQMKLSDFFVYRFELGFDLFCYLSSKISKNPQMLIFSSTAFINFFVLRYIYKNCKIPWLGVVLNLMRFLIACSILIYANYYIINRSFVRTLLIVLIASSFHFSALLYMLLYFAYYFRLNIKTILLAIVVFVIVSKTFLDLFSLLIQFNTKYTSYANGNGDFDQSSFANILLMVLQLFIFLYIILMVKNRLSVLERFEKLAIISLFIALLMSVAAIKIMMFTRFLTMFSLIEIVFIPNLLYKYYRKPIYYLHTLLFLVVTLSEVVVIFLYRPEWYAILPYRNYLFE